MSLTSFLRANKDVRDRFRQEFAKPVFPHKRDILAPPLSKRFPLTGSAFDYLMRFYLKRLNPDAITKRWIAELSITHPLSRLLQDAVIDARTGKVISFTETDLTKKVQRLVYQAREDYSIYVSTGELTNELIKSALCLAQLDPIFRAGFIDENIGIVHEDDIADLRNLIGIVDPVLFTARDLCLLNPSFDEGSKLVGGADTDLFIDGKIIDIKTTKRFELQRRDFDQIMGYYTLYEIGGIGGLSPKPPVTSVGIYYSRYAYLYVLPIEDIIDNRTFPEFVDWFKMRAVS